MRLMSRTLALLAAIGAAACSDSSNGPDGQQNGSPRVTVRLTDAPGDIKAAVVTISEVNLQGGPNGAVVLMSTPITTDLIDLSNSTAILVDDAVVPEGQYSEMRFVITGGYIEVENASGGTDIYASSPNYAGLPAGAVVTGDLQMPSLGTSGLKIQFDGSVDLDIDEDQDFLVDFDVSQSFGHQAGNSGKWVMHPVVKGASFTTASTVKATLKLGTGVTLPTIGGVALTLGAVKAKLGGEVVDFTDSDGDVTFEAEFRMLIPGNYQLELVLPAGLVVTTNPVLPFGTSAAAGQTTTVAITIATAVAG